MFVSQSELARIRKVTPQAINKLVRQGRIPVNAKKQVNLPEAMRILDGDLDPSWTESPLANHRLADDEADESAAGGSEFREVKTQSERLRAEALQFDLDVKRGRYLLKQEVLDAMVNSGRRIRQMLDGAAEWADELCATAPGGPQEVRRLLKQKIRALEQQMADAISLRDGDDEQERDGSGPVHQ